MTEFLNSKSSEKTPFFCVVLVEYLGHMECLSGTEAVLLFSKSVLGRCRKLLN